MVLYWLTYRVNDDLCVVLQPADSLIAAKLTAATRTVPEGTFAEAHPLHAKTAKRVPKHLIGHCLTHKQALDLIKRLDSRR